MYCVLIGYLCVGLVNKRRRLTYSSIAVLRHNKVFYCCIVLYCFLHALRCKWYEWYCNWSRHYLCYREIGNPACYVEVQEEKIAEVNIKAFELYFVFWSLQKFVNMAIVRGYWCDQISYFFGISFGHLSFFVSNLGCACRHGGRLHNGFPIWADEDYAGTSRKAFWCTYM